MRSFHYFPMSETYFFPVAIERPSRIHLNSKPLQNQFERLERLWEYCGTGKKLATGKKLLSLIRQSALWWNDLIISRELSAAHGGCQARPDL